ncbi:MAG TPA: NUDIX hydrolase [Gemmatimonadaceae bacterium]|jgi:ADP-ribose pyrophosphatase
MSESITPGKISSRRVHTGKIITVDQDTVRFPDGSEGQLDIVRHPGASAIVPFMSDPAGDDPQLLLIKQYRYAAGGYLYEIPAGRLDGGEDPRDCAARELKEETGCTAERLEHVYSMLTTPGFSDEIIHLFVASGLERGDHAREADEFMTVEVVSLSNALLKIKKGEIRDAKTALGILFVAGFVAGR